MNQTLTRRVRRRSLFACVRSLDPVEIWSASNAASRFLDREGAVPSGAGDPVGMLLGQKNGLSVGENIVASGPGTINAPWVDNGDGTYSIDGSQASEASLFYAGTLTVGSVYKVTITVFSASDMLRAGSVGNSPDYGVGTTSCYVFAPSNNFGIYAPAGVSATIGGIEVREVFGHHITAPTLPERPTYQTAGGLHWLEFDGVDDNLQISSGWPFSETPYVAMAFTVDGSPVLNSNILIVRGTTGGDLSERQPLIYYNQSGNRVTVDFGGVITHAITGVTFGQVYVLQAWVEAGGTVMTRVNGVEATGNSGALLTEGADASLYLGSPSSGSTWDGKCYGLTIYFPSAPNAAGRDLIDQWLAREAGVTL